MNIDTNLIAQELIQVTKFISVIDLSIQWCVPLLLDTGGSADLNGGIATGSRNSGCWAFGTWRMRLRGTGFWAKNKKSEREVIRSKSI